MNEIDSILEEFERDPEDKGVQQKILNLAREQSDPSELIRKIIRGCVSKLSKKGSCFAVGVSYDFCPGKSESTSQQLGSSPGPLGKLHSEHLYLAAKCIGCNKNVDKEMFDNVINRLLSEFDIEITFPQAAIAAFGDIGERATPRLMEYLRDRQKETFSREDAALALGAIGTDKVVEELSDYLAQVDYGDMGMSLYALGKTRNPKARKPILDFLNSYPNHPKTWVAQNALGEIPSS